MFGWSAASTSEAANSPAIRIMSAFIDGFPRTERCFVRESVTSFSNSLDPTRQSATASRLPRPLQELHFRRTPSPRFRQPDQPACGALLLCTVDFTCAKKTPSNPTNMLHATCRRGGSAGVVMKQVTRWALSRKSSKKFEKVSTQPTTGVVEERQRRSCARLLGDLLFLLIWRLRYTRLTQEVFPTARSEPSRKGERRR